MERERRVKKGLGYDRWENVNEKERKRRADGDERSSAPSAHIGSTQSGTAGKERKEEGEKGGRVAALSVKGLQKYQMVASAAITINSSSSAAREGRE